MVENLFNILLTKYPGQIVAVIERQNSSLDKLQVVATNNINDILTYISSLYDNDPNYHREIELNLTDLTVVWLNSHQNVRDSVSVYFAKEQGKCLFDLYTILLKQGVQIINPPDIKPLLSNAEGRLYQIIENKT